MAATKPRILNAGTAYVSDYGIVVMYEKRQYVIPFEIIKTIKKRNRWWFLMPYIYLDTENGEFEITSYDPSEINLLMLRIEYYHEKYRAGIDGNMDDSTG